MVSVSRVLREILLVQRIANGKEKRLWQWGDAEDLWYASLKGVFVGGFGADSVVTRRFLKGTTTSPSIGWHAMLVLLVYTSIRFVETRKDGEKYNVTL